jgi:hypothetical protein
MKKGKKLIITIKERGERGYIIISSLEGESQLHSSLGASQRSSIIYYLRNAQLEI